MAAEPTDKKGNKVKFIRKNGRVIPIRAKGAGGGDNKTKGRSSSSKYNKKERTGKKAAKQYDTGSNMASKAKRKRTKHRSRFVGTGAVAGLASGVLAGRGSILKSIVGGLAGVVVGSNLGAAVADRTKKGKRIGRSLSKGRRMKSKALGKAGSSEVASDSFRTNRNYNTGF